MRKHRRRKWHAEVGIINPSSILSRLRDHPVRSALFGAMGLILIWVVLTKSLPYALAPSAPETALALNPNNPAALIAKAEMVHAQLLTVIGAFEQAGAQEGGVSKGDSIDRPRDAKTEKAGEQRGELEGLRKEVRRLAIQTVANDPLNAEAFRLLAETTDSPSGVRVLMQEALKRSRRHSVALLWLLNDRYYHKDFSAALDHANMLLRTHPELSSYVLSYLALIAAAPEGSPLIVEELAKSPSWRLSFFQAFPQQVKQSDIPLKLMVALKESGKPPANKELAPYLNFLISKNSVEEAYNAWLQFLPKAELDTLGFLTHANFEQDPTGLAFDWQIAQGLNSIAEFRSFGSQGERALHITFSGGRIRFPEVSQVVILPPGKYRLEGKLRGTIIAKRGLRWQLRCINGSHVLGETDMLMGQSQEWRIFKLEAEVPQSEDCRGQTLRLFHDSRSASEEFITGEAWFTGLHLERVAEPKVVMQ